MVVGYHHVRKPPYQQLQPISCSSSTNEQVKKTLLDWFLQGIILPLVIRIILLAHGNLCLPPSIREQACRFVPRTSLETTPQIVPRYLNIAFQGLAA